MHNIKWWEPETPPGIDEKEYQRMRAQALVQETAAIEMRQNAWHEFNLWNSTLFYNRQLPAFRWGSIAADVELYPADLRTENLIETIGQTMVSKASSQPLIPSPTPHSSSYTVHRAVSQLQKFIAETWRLTESENASIQAFLDAYVSSVGAVQVNVRDGKISVDPIFFDNIIIDNRECVNRTPPRTVRKRMVLPRVAVETMYDIELYGPQEQYLEARAVGTDWTVLVEAFRKPDKKGKGGRWMGACEGHILFDLPWNEQWIPIVFFHWSDPGSGFFSRSGVEQCIPYQVAHNDLNEAIKNTQDICSRPRLLSHANSNIDVNQWDNEFGRILGYTGTKPEPFEWPTNLNDLYQERERNRSTCFSYFGLSEMSAGADLPAQVRLDSSAGVREFRNMEDSRHLRLWTRFEKFRLEVAHRIIDMLGKFGKGGKYKVSYMGTNEATAEEINWDDIKDIQKGQYSWTLDAVPLASQSPAARRETLSAWQAEGKIKPTDDISMMGNPDLEEIDDMEMASVNGVKRILAKLEKGEYEPPAEYTNLVWGIPACIANIEKLKAFTEGVHEEAIALHERWLLDAMNRQQANVMAMQQALPQPAANPGFDPNQGVQGQIQ